MFILILGLIVGFSMGVLFGRVFEMGRIINYLTYRFDNAEGHERVLSDCITGIVLDDHHKLARGELVR